MQEKLCPKCNCTKSIHFFGADSSTKSGIRSWCKDCCKKSRLAYYYRTRTERIKSTARWNDNHRERFLKNQSRRRQEIKQELINGYGGKCVCCGENDPAFLTIEHINGGGRAHRGRVGSLAVYKEVIKNGFPEDYTVLCMNCNFARRYGKECPHKTNGNAKEELVVALKDMMKAYVRLLECARDRIIDSGGQCDPVDQMEKGDPYLLKGRAAIQKAEAAP